MEYNVKLKLQVKDLEGNVEFLSKELKLPFTPFIGLQILLEKGTSGNPSDPIAKVMWNHWSEWFVCEVDWRFMPETTYENGLFWDLNAHVSIAQSDGWELD